LGMTIPPCITFRVAENVTRLADRGRLAAAESDGTLAVHAWQRQQVLVADVEPFRSRALQ
jgi:hypothetical protein